MGHWEDSRIAFEQRLETNWQLAGSPPSLRTPIRWWRSGAPFQETGATHITFEVLYGRGGQVTIGQAPQWHRYPGQIIQQIFTPSNQGPAEAEGLIELLDPIWRHQEFKHGVSGLIRCETPSIQHIGHNRGWYQLNLVCPFMREIKH